MTFGWVCEFLRNQGRRSSIIVRQMRRTVPLLPLLLLTAAAHSQPAQIDAAVEKLMKSRRVPAVSLAVIRDGKVVYSKGYGYSDLENGVKATPATVYEVGSITKQFTSALVMMLVEEGKVKLDEPVRTYMPDLPEAWKEVTVRQLLTHTSGIKSYTSLSAFRSQIRERIDHEGMINLLKDEKLDFAPGTKWSYNNSGYYLLGMLLEKLTGKRYADLLRERIFTPLGMTSTRYNDLRAVIPNRAHGYDLQSLLPPANTMVIDMSWPFSAGAIVASVEDFAKWDAALYPGKLFKAETLEQMWTPVKLPDGTNTHYGFGWMITDLSGERAVGHGGDINGFNAYFVRVPSKHLAVAAFCNAAPGITELITARVLQVVDKSLKPAEPKGINDPDPATTTRLRKVFDDILKGKIDQSAFDSRTLSILQGRLAPLQNEVGEDGPTRKFYLTSTEMRGPRKVLIYYALLETRAVQVTLILNEDGKISGMGVNPL